MSTHRSSRSPSPGSAIALDDVPCGGADPLDERRYRVWLTPRRSARFGSLDDARAFAGGLFHDRVHVVILEKLAPGGCWLQLDRFA
ncbi:MAG: hypothetical protein VKM34_01825 [Cyanobacteriota bacterium]|nr:hypothetical protein [Cyanobacteriota bacterium]